MVELAEFGNALVVSWFLAPELSDETSQILDSEAEDARKDALGCKGNRG
jgi:hypothetical protein